MLRIGIIANPSCGNAWLEDALRSLQASEFVELALIVVTAASSALAQPPLVDERLRTHWSQSLFLRYQQWDYKKNRAEDDALSARDLTSLLSAVPRVVLSPAQQSSAVEFSPEDLAIIKAADLDVLVNFEPRTVQRAVLSFLRYGLWSFYYGDNGRYQGGPPCFWEIYENNPVSGSGLQIMTERSDEPRVIYQSHSSTRQTSLYLNRNPIYWKTAEFLIRRLSDLHL